MSPDLFFALNEYEDYSDIFAKQIFSRELWKEQTGCELEEEYVEYLKCCSNKLYSFSVWYEHTKGTPYPSTGDWIQYRDYKASIKIYS